MQEILDFIEIFQSDSNKILFTEVACYWFANILKTRFGGTIMYNPDQVHFATLIRGQLYDITGCLEYEGFNYWSSYNELDKDDIINSVILLKGGE